MIVTKNPKDGGKRGDMMNMFKYLTDRHMGERLAASSALGAGPETEVGNPVKRTLNLNY